jgi:hypothetical protein
MFFCFFVLYGWYFSFWQIDKRMRSQLLHRDAISRTELTKQQIYEKKKEKKKEILRQNSSLRRSSHHPTTKLFWAKSNSHRQHFERCQTAQNPSTSHIKPHPI